MSEEPELAFKKEKPHVMPPPLVKLRFGIRLVFIQFLIVAICFLGWILWHFNQDNIVGKWIQIIVPVAGALSTLIGMLGMIACFAGPKRMTGKGNLAGGLVFYFLVLIIKPVLIAGALAVAVGLGEEQSAMMQWAVFLHPLIYIAAMWVFWLLGSVFFLVFLFRLAEFFEDEELMNRIGDLVKRGALLAIWLVVFATLFAVWIMVIVDQILFMSILKPAPLFFTIFFFITIFLLVFFMVRSMQVFEYVRDALAKVTEDQLEF